MNIIPIPEYIKNQAQCYEGTETHKKSRACKQFQKDFGLSHTWIYNHLKRNDTGVLDLGYKQLVIKMVAIHECD